MEPVWTLHRPSCMCTILVVCLGLSTHFNLLLNSKGEQHVSTNSKTHSYFQVRSSLLLVPKNVRNCNSPKPHRARSVSFVPFKRLKLDSCPSLSTFSSSSQPIEGESTESIQMCFARCSSVNLCERHEVYAAHTESK